MHIFHNYNFNQLLFFLLYNIMNKNNSLNIYTTIIINVYIYTTSNSLIIY